MLQPRNRNNVVATSSQKCTGGARVHGGSWQLSDHHTHRTFEKGKDLYLKMSSGMRSMMV